ncbi:dentin sialophosphoprotein isoform X1 [Euwallacea fornicatus]|uniref:dentin sialophosphoprotein isoform X1 n=2 Tax=Euwallacea fornicatus TaxID=995702 RepID=UPI00338E45B1
MHAQILGAVSSKMTTEDNGNISGVLKPTSSSNEDLSEYTDADESISAPTEFLAEFLSAVMLKDYITALKYCKLILQYEPNNATAKEFYPLILEKLKQNISIPNGNDEEGSSNDSEAEDSEASSSTSASDSSAGEESSEGQEDAEEEEEEIGAGVGGKVSKGSSEGDGTTGSYSSLEDDEAENDQLTALVAKYQIDNVNLGNGNKFCPTAHITPTFLKDKTYPIDNSPASNLRTQQQKTHFMTSSDSESPTDPCQTTVAVLRGRVVPNNV